MGVVRVSVPLRVSTLNGNAGIGAAVGRRTVWNDGWEFQRQGEAEFALDWRKLDLPHDWGIESGFERSLPGETGKLRWWGRAQYRKKLMLGAEDRDRRILLEIEGAMSNASVWVNGRRVGEWAYGYTTFRIDLTSYLHFEGENPDGNLIEIRLDNLPDSSRWYPGGGLYRNVWLVKCGRLHVAFDSPVVATRELAADGSQALLDINLEFSNTTPVTREIRVVTRLHRLEMDGSLSGDAIASTAPAEIELLPNAVTLHTARATISHPELWDVHSNIPVGASKVDRSTAFAPLYMAVTTLEDPANGEILDRTQAPFGIRILRFDSVTGFHLNHSPRPTRIQGVCLHHDLGPLGAAAHFDAIVRQLTLLRDMGCNAIRCAHNPPAPSFLDACDRMGFLVMNELCDAWRIAKKPNGYQTLFDAWAERDLCALVRRDRHHPSVILWSIGNEIPEQTSPDGPALSARLADLVRANDFERRPVTGGMNIPESGFNGWQKAYDVFGYNYKPHLYAAFREANPAIPLLGAETASCVSSRGEYAFPVSDDLSGGVTSVPPYHVSSYDLYAPAWATTPDREFAAQDLNTPGILGEFVWTGFDYLGEPTPFNDDSTNLLNAADPATREAIRAMLASLSGLQLPARSSYFGIFDLCGFPKDRYFLYQARWRPDLPMAHILPHWDWPERLGAITPVHVYTAGEEAELFLNGCSQGIRRRGRSDYRLRWDDVRYEPGELRVVVRKEDRPWTEATRRTTGPAKRIELKVDYFHLPNGITASPTLAFVTARITDADGQLCPRANDRLHFALPEESPLELLAVDNGDPTRLESFKAKNCCAFNGLALAIFRLRQNANQNQSRSPASVFQIRVHSADSALTEGTFANALSYVNIAAPHCT